MEWGSLKKTDGKHSEEDTLSQPRAVHLIWSAVAVKVSPRRCWDKEEKEEIHERQWKKEQGRVMRR